MAKCVFDWENLFCSTRSRQANDARLVVPVRINITPDENLWYQRYDMLPMATHICSPPLMRVWNHPLEKFCILRENERVPMRIIQRVIGI